MKKNLIAVLSAGILAGCGGGGGDDSAASATQNPTPPAAKPLAVDLTQFHNCTSAACSSDVVAKFHLAAQVWDAPIVNDEPVLPVSASLPLWRDSSSILTVRNRQTGQVYAYGTDYTLDAGRLTIPTGSAITLLPADWAYTAIPGTEDLQPITKSGKPLRIALDYQQNQIAVTYTSAVPALDMPQLGTIPVTAAKIAVRNPTAITYYGDSITAGADSTASLGIAPGQWPWVDLVGAMLSNGGDGAVYWRNVAVGGWSPAQGLEHIEEKVNTSASDLVVLAFGQNGGGSEAEYEANMRAMVAAIRAKAPATEILLVAPWLGNNEWVVKDTSQWPGYRSALWRIAHDTAGVAVADMTTLSTSVLIRKTYYDVTSNGVNHPGDFIHVAYAQVVKAAIR